MSYADEAKKYSDAELIQKLKQPHSPYSIDVSVTNEAIMRLMAKNTVDARAAKEVKPSDGPKKLGRPAKPE